MKRAHLLTLISPLIFACSSKSSEPVPANCTTELARGLSRDTSGDAAEQAYRDHIPTIEEQKLIAVFWAFAIPAIEEGSFDEAFVLSDIPQQLAVMTSSYDSFFTNCPRALSAGGTATSGSGIRTCKDFTCDSECKPDVQLLPKTVEKISEAIFGQIGGTVLDELSKAKVISLRTKIRQEVSKHVVDQLSAQAAQQYRQIAVGAVTEDEATQMIQVVSSLLTAQGAIATAAAKIAAGTPEAAVAAQVASAAAAAGTLVVSFELGVEVGKALGAVSECLAYKRDKCSGGDPMTTPCGCSSDMRCPDGACRSIALGCNPQADPCSVVGLTCAPSDSACIRTACEANSACTFAAGFCVSLPSGTPPPVPPTPGVPPGPITGCPSPYEGTWMGTFNYEYDDAYDNDGNPVSKTMGSLSVTFSFSCLAAAAGSVVLNVTYASASDSAFGCTMGCTPMTPLSVATLPMTRPTSLASPSQPGQGVLVFLPSGAQLGTENGAGSLSVNESGTQLWNGPEARADDTWISTGADGSCVSFHSGAEDGGGCCVYVPYTHTYTDNTGPHTVLLRAQSCTRYTSWTLTKQ